MAKYVLGDEGARKFKQLLQTDLASGSSQRYGRSPVLDNAYPHPYEVRWSNSMVSTDYTPGGYMIWLPNDCLYINLSCISLSSFPQIRDRSIRKIDNSWYKLSRTALDVESLHWPDEFDIWLNFGLSNNVELVGPKFSTLSNSLEKDSETTTEDIKQSSIHIAHINNYRPNQFVRSSLIIGGLDVPPDEQSISISSDVIGLSSYLSASWTNKLHVTGFHTYGDATFYDNSTSFIVRQGGGGIANPPTGAEYMDYLNVANFKSEILQDFIDNLSNDTSALAVDEQSVSKGGDGWAISSESGENPALHMWHFHDSAADVNNPEMCDIVLRYNPERASDDKWLRYISYEDLKAKLSSDIGGGGSGGGEITPSQLSAVPCWGMFAWTEKTRTMGAGGCMVGRQWYTCTNGVGSGKADGLYQLRVSIYNSGVVQLAVVSDATLGQAPTTT